MNIFLHYPKKDFSFILKRKFEHRVSLLTLILLLSNLYFSSEVFAQSVTPLGSINGSAVASTLDGKIWSINLDNGTAIEITQSPFFLDGVNGLAINETDGLIYYVSERGYDRRMYAYDMQLDSHYVVPGLDVFTTNPLGVGQGGASFYGNSLYVGVEDVIPGGGSVSDVIYKVDFEPNSSCKRISETVPKVYKNYRQEWGDFVIKDDIIYNNVVGSFEAMKINGAPVASHPKTYFGQLGKSYNGKLFNIDDNIQEINADYTSPNFGQLIGSSIPITLDCNQTWDVPLTGYNPGKDAIDATGPAPANSCVGDLVFYDANANGLQDSLELGIPGVSISFWQDFNNDNVITPAKDQLLTTVVTGIDGKYKICGLQPGNFLVTITNIDSLMENPVLSYGVNPKPMKVNKFNKFFADGDFGFKGTLKVLPVEFQYVRVAEVDCKAEIKWATASEKNSKYFEVQKSEDNVNFHTMAFIPAAGTTSEPQYYKFVDNNPTSKTYYRLKEVDIDGTPLLSNTVSVLVYCDGHSNLMDVFPNPAEKNVNVRFAASEDKKCTVLLRDNNLKVINTFERFAKKGSNVFDIELNNIPSGEYNITILFDGSRTLTQKFIKVER